MIGLIIISHSKMLADGLHQLILQIQNQQQCQVVIAAGIDDDLHPIGTDAVKVMEAIETLSDASQIILLMDLGSALLSAETALDLVDPTLAEKVYLCSAPLVEGAIAITAAASSGASIERILSEAHQALLAKQQQLNDTVTQEPSHHSDTRHFSPDAQVCEWTVKNPAGLHIRPAAKLSSLLGQFKAKLTLCKDEKCADAKSMNQIALLQVHQNDKIRLIAEGSDSQAAIDAFEQLAQQNFGDNVSTTTQKRLVGKAPYRPTISGIAHHWPTSHALTEPKRLNNEEEIRRSIQAISRLQSQLDTLADSVTDRYGDSIADIFRGHRLLLDDDEIIESVKQKILSDNTSAFAAIQSVFDEMSAQYRQLDDAYLQARFIDIDDLKNQLLMLLSSMPFPSATFSQPTLILSDSLGPSQLICCQSSMIVAIALAKGSRYSHTSIIASRMGIPMLVELGDALLSIPEQSKVTMSIEESALSIE